MSEFRMFGVGGSCRIGKASGTPLRPKAQADLRLQGPQMGALVYVYWVCTFTDEQY